MQHPVALLDLLRVLALWCLEPNLVLANRLRDGVCVACWKPDLLWAFSVGPPVARAIGRRGIVQDDFDNIFDPDDPLPTESEELLARAVERGSDFWEGLRVGQWDFVIWRGRRAGRLGRTGGGSEGGWSIGRFTEWVVAGGWSRCSGVHVCFIGDRSSGFDTKRI